MATLDEALALAVDHHAAGRLPEAEALYRRIVDAVPGQPDALHLLGVLHGQTGRAEAGIPLISAALAARPDTPECHANLGGLLRATGRLDAAVAAYRRALSLAPAFLDAADGLVMALHARGPADAARPALEWLIRLNPAHQKRGGLALLLEHHGAALLKAGQPAAALRALSRAAELAAPGPELLFQLGNARCVMADLSGAVRAYRVATLLDPAHAPAWLNHGIVRQRLADHERAAAAIARAVAIVPDDLDARENLVIALYRLRRSGEAAEHGAAALDLKELPVVPLPAPRPRSSHPRDVVAFSLWGAEPLYTEGAVANARLMPTIYPGWTCRVYHDDSVPAATLAALSGLAVELVAMAPGSGPVQGLYWRFLASDDPAVGRFVCRDCDSRINRREAAAVAAWIASGRDFHVMRDHVLHTEVVMAGMWGGRAGVLPPLRPAIDAHAHPDRDRWQDQRFLRSQVWPRIRDHCLVHDSAHPRHGAPFPDSPPDPVSSHVGARVQPG